MSPLELEVLTVYAITEVDVRNLHLSVVEMACLDWVEKGILQSWNTEPGHDRPRFKITDKGKVYWEEIMARVNSVPLPEREWVIPGSAGWPGKWYCEVDLDPAPPAPPDTDAFTKHGLDVSILERGFDFIKMVVKAKGPGDGES